MKNPGAIITFFIIIFIMVSPSTNAEKIYHEEGFHKVNGVNHYYEIYGEGEPFILIHGGPGMYHDELVPFFMEFAKDHRVIFYDQRGNGQSK